jgi:peptidoglycan glycosyltransferase
MNVRIRHLSIALIALFGVLFIQLQRWQVFDRQELETHPRNNRLTLREFNSPRGQIVTADGVVIAQSVPVEDGESQFAYQRVYPEGELFAHVTGYYTLNYGSTQLERVFNDVLAGKTAAQQLIGAGDLFTRADTSGSIVVTVRADIQRVAQRELAGRIGSVVALDTRTGAVLAMYSNPSYDPNQVAAHGNSTGDVLLALQEDPEKPLQAHTYQERYMPGSTFKILTTAIGLESGTITEDTVFPEETEWTPPNTDKPIRNYGGRPCGGDLITVFARSCNIPFAQTAVNTGPQQMVDGTKKFGLEERIPFELPGAVASTFGGDANSFEDSLALLAIHGFGQGSVQIVPMHMSMIAGAVANNGAMMRPYVVGETRYNDGRVLSRGSQTTWKQAMLPTTAEQLNRFMQEVVRRGTASCCLRLANGVTAAAKTGTAQLNPEGETQRSHAWITAFAPAEAPRVVVAVMLKGVNDEISAGTGGRLAGPIAKKVLDAALAVIPATPTANSPTTVANSGQ